MIEGFRTCFLLVRSAAQSAPDRFFDYDWTVVVKDTPSIVDQHAKKVD